MMTEISDDCSRTDRLLKAPLQLQYTNDLSHNNKFWLENGVK